MKQVGMTVEGMILVEMGREEFEAFCALVMVIEGCSIDEMPRFTGMGAGVDLTSVFNVIQEFSITADYVNLAMVHLKQISRRWNKKETS